jgi:hypothetical protein
MGEGERFEGSPLGVDRQAAEALTRHRKSGTPPRFRESWCGRRGGDPTAMTPTNASTPTRARAARAIMVGHSGVGQRRRGPIGQASLGVFRAPETDVVMPGRRAA